MTQDTFNLKDKLCFRLGHCEVTYTHTHTKKKKKKKKRRRRKSKGKNADAVISNIINHIRIMRLSVLGIRTSICTI